MGDDVLRKQRTVPVDCDAIFSDEVYITRGHGQSTAPKNIPLNPWGDVFEIARAHCMSKDTASLVIAVMSGSGHDVLDFNAHRIYGNLRWPYLVSNWEQVYREPGGEQVVHVLSKSETISRQLTWSDYRIGDAIALRSEAPGCDHYPNSIVLSLIHI